jgi:hypothetical protein
MGGKYSILIIGILNWRRAFRIKDLWVAKVRECFLDGFTGHVEAPVLPDVGR